MSGRLILHFMDPKDEQETEKLDKPLEENLADERMSSFDRLEVKLKNMNQEQQQQEEQDKLEKMLRQREHVINEIISTEYLYVQRLESTVEVFISPLRNTKIIDKNDFQSQFQLFEDVYELHARHCKKIEKVKEVETEDTFYSFDSAATPSKPVNPTKIDFITLFEDILANFTFYSDYLVNFEPAMQRRGYLLTANRKFAEFIEKSQQESSRNLQLGGGGIESLLILPVQRIPRYRLLLEQLIKFTPENHPQFDSIRLVFDRICEIAQYNNEAIRARENQQKTMEIMMAFEPRTRIDLLNDSARRFVKEGPLIKLCRYIPH
jgi:hypothetical protein